MLHYVNRWENNKIDSNWMILGNRRQNRLVDN
jgi:hypothetical protein